MKAMRRMENRIGVGRVGGQYLIRMDVQLGGGLKAALERVNFFPLLGSQLKVKLSRRPRMGG